MVSTIYFDMPPLIQIFAHARLPAPPLDVVWPRVAWPRPNAGLDKNKTNSNCGVFVKISGRNRNLGLPNNLQLPLKLAFEMV